MKRFVRWLLSFQLIKLRLGQVLFSNKLKQCCKVGYIDEEAGTWTGTLMGGDKKGQKITWAIANTCMPHWKLPEYNGAIRDYDLLCTSCGGSLHEMGIMWFFSDTTYYVCDTCMSSLPAGVLAKNIFAKTRDDRIKAHLQETEPGVFTWQRTQ